MTRVKLVNKDLKIISISLGETVLMALTDDGSVHSVGFGASLGHEKQITSNKSNLIFSAIPFHSNQQKIEREIVSELLDSPTTISKNQVERKKTKKKRKKQIESSEEKPFFSFIVCLGATSFAITKGGLCYIWGKVDKINQIENPMPIRKFEKDFQITKVAFSFKKLILIHSLCNSETFKFFSFEPPVIQCGTYNDLFNWLFHEKCSQDYHNTFLKTFTKFVDPLTLIKSLKEK